MKLNRILFFSIAMIIMGLALQQSFWGERSSEAKEAENNTYRLAEQAIVPDSQGVDLNVTAVVITGTGIAGAFLLCLLLAKHNGLLCLHNTKETDSFTRPDNVC